jgi:hypothetical protein
LLVPLLGALYNRTALPPALWVGISGALAGITYFAFLSRLRAATPPGQGEHEC